MRAWCKPTARQAVVTSAGAEPGERANGNVSAAGRRDVNRLMLPGHCVEVVTVRRHGILVFWRA